MHTLLALLARHKMVALAVVLALGGGGYWYSQKTVSIPPRYVVAAVSRGSVLTSITGSGQVSGKTQLEVKPTVSGKVTKVLVKNGDEIKMGMPIIEIDPKEVLKNIRDANKAVSDARVNLESAQLSYNKLKLPVDASTLLQAQNAVNTAQRAYDELVAGPDAFDLAQAEQLVTSAEEDLVLAPDGSPKSVRDVYDTIVPSLKTTAQSFQQILIDVETALEIKNGQIENEYNKLILDNSALVNANNGYLSAKASVARFKQQTDALALTNENAVKIEATLVAEQDTIAVLDPLLQTVYQVVSATVPSASRSQSTIDSLRSTIQSDRSTLSSKTTTLISQRQSITAAQESYRNAQTALEKAKLSLQKLQAPPNARDLAAAQEKIEQATLSLSDAKKGSDAIDLQLSANTIAQRRASVTAAQNTLQDVQATLADYTVKAPFDGVLANVDVHVADSISPSTILATLITEAKIATLSVNEVDAAKIRLGQKATLTFDAIPDLTIAGTVSNIDAIGTVSQGVVSYSIEILFQTQDDRVKPGMTVVASIITAIRSDVLTVPNAALQSVGGQTSVQILSAANMQAATAGVVGVFAKTPPESRLIQTGLVNDEVTEITGGLDEGEQIVIRTILETAAIAPATGATGGLRIQGLGGAGGGFTGGARPAGR